MKWLYPAVILTTVLLSATPATAQTSSATLGPTVDLWYAGGSTGIAAVQKTGALLSAEAGIRVMKNLDVSLELGWFQNTTTRRRSDSATTMAVALEQPLQQTVTGSVKVPTTYGSVNARYVFENQRAWRPYAVLGIGGARVAPESTFSSGGATVSDAVIAQYLTLGLDLSGHRSHPAFTGGGGVLMPFGKLYADVGIRMTTIRAEGQPINVGRLNIGMGARF